MALRHTTRQFRAPIARKPLCTAAHHRWNETPDFPTAAGTVTHHPCIQYTILTASYGEIRCGQVIWLLSGTEESAGQIPAPLGRVAGRLPYGDTPFTAQP